MSFGTGRPDSYPVRIEPDLALRLTPEERHRREREAIEALMELAPEAQRKEVRAVVEDRSVSLSASSDPEVARLLGIIVSIRTADAIEAERARSGIPHHVLKDLKRRVPVLVVLVKELPRADALAVVIRYPGDDVMPRLLVPEKAATALDLRRGLVTAAAARVRHGPVVETRVELALRFGGHAIAERTAVDLAPGARVLSDLRARPTGRIPGVGKGKAAVIAAPPVTWR